MNRRDFLKTGAASAAIILTPGLLMPVRALAVPKVYVGVFTANGLSWLHTDLEDAFKRTALEQAEMLVNPPLVKGDMLFATSENGVVRLIGTAFSQMKVR